MGAKLVTRGGEGLRTTREEAVMADQTYKFVCTVCGWEVEVDTPELPDDFVCEVCGVGADMFEKVED